MKIQWENTASYEGKLTIDGKELEVTLEDGRIVVKKLPLGRENLGHLVAKYLAPVLFNVIQAEAIVEEEHCCDGFNNAWLSLGHEKLAVQRRLS